MSNTNDEKMWSLYIHIINKNISDYDYNKYYVGITSQEPQKRWKNGNGYKTNNYFYNAIQKYGWDNIEHKILFTGLTIEQANRLEQIVIATLRSNCQEYGYNIQNGGQLGKFSDDTKLKISKANTGKIRTEETKRLLSEMHKGKKLTNEWIVNRTKSQTGLKRSSDTCEKISMALKKPVICLNTRIVFQSMTDIQLQTGINITHISQCCNKKRRCAGKDLNGNNLFWMWYDEYLSINGNNLSFEELLSYCKQKLKPGKIGEKVRCINTSIIYENAQQASDITGVCRTNISKCCNGLRKSAGKDENGNKLFWEYVN